MKTTRFKYSDRAFTVLGLALALFLGLSAFLGCTMLNVGYADPLVVALILGI